MSTPTRQPRKATGNVTYSNPPEYEGIDSDEDASEEEEEEWGGKRTRKGKGKANKQRTSRAGDSSEEDDDDAKPASKKRRAIKGTRKGKKGKLATVPTLPVELLLEIFSHLGPKELLALSNTSKTYHALLAGSASSSPWKTARKRYELPDLEIDNLTELQYAHLVFGTHCQLCRKKKVKHADWYLLKRTCADCRKTHLVRLDQLKRGRNDLHPLARDCVLQTFSEWAYTAVHPFGLVQDLEYYSDILWNLERVPDAAPNQSPAVRSAPSSVDGRRTTRSSRTASLNYAEIPDSDDEGLSKLKSSRAAEDFVKSRRSIVGSFRETGRDRRRAAEAAVKQATLTVGEEPAVRGDESWQLSWQRQKDPEAKVKELDPTFKVSLEALTDKIWERIKPQVLKVADRERAYVVAEARVRADKDRQRELRPRYDELEDTLDESARPFLPLFVDFLLLPSVRPLWENLDVELDDAAWNDSLDGVLEEVEQYRLDLCFHARACILAATEDDDGSPTAQHDVDEIDLSDAHWRGPPNEDCIGIASLFELLEHQHKVHNRDDSLEYSWTHKAWPNLKFRVHLPPEVACSMSALLEIGKLDPATADEADLYTLSRNGHLVWENAPLALKKFSGWQSWRKLLVRIKRSVTTLERGKTPQTLDPPCIAFHPDDELSRDKGKGKMRAFLSEEDDYEELVNSDGDESRVARFHSENEE
ncbi:hypothetical protein JCM10207_001563 [Rhodosporidiobolus poonsookiae]